MFFSQICNCFQFYNYSVLYDHVWDIMSYYFTFIIYIQGFLTFTL